MIKKILYTASLFSLSLNYYLINLKEKHQPKTIFQRVHHRQPAIKREAKSAPIGAVTAKTDSSKPCATETLDKEAYIESFNPREAEEELREFIIYNLNGNSELSALIINIFKNKKEEFNQYLELKREKDHKMTYIFDAEDYIKLGQTKQEAMNKLRELLPNSEFQILNRHIVNLREKGLFPLEI